MANATNSSSKNEVIFYHKPTCPFCKMALHLLQSNGIRESEIKMINTADDLDARDYAHKHYGKTVPQIIVNKTHIGGCDDLMDTLDEGKFLKLLNK